MTIRDIFEFAESKGQADLPIVVYSDIDKEFYEAKRLLKFLDYILGMYISLVPANSILREFIGGGCFDI